MVATAKGSGNPAQRSGQPRVTIAARRYDDSDGDGGDVLNTSRLYSPSAAMTGWYKSETVGLLGLVDRSVRVGDGGCIYS